MTGGQDEAAAAVMTYAASKGWNVHRIELLRERMDRLEAAVVALQKQVRKPLWCEAMDRLRAVEVNTAKAFDDIAKELARLRSIADHLDRKECPPVVPQPDQKPQPAPHATTEWTAVGKQWQASVTLWHRSPTADQVRQVMHETWGTDRKAPIAELRRVMPRFMGVLERLVGPIADEAVEPIVAGQPT